MNCQADIIWLADEKLKSAECLLNNGLLDNAYYIGGYSIELLLKASVCKTLKIDDFFDEKSGWFRQVKYPQTYKNHDLNQLLVLSGIYKEHEKMQNDPSFKTSWSIVKQWNENHRYLTGKSKKEVEDFLISLKAICSWIKKHL